MMHNETQTANQRTTQTTQNKNQRTTPENIKRHSQYRNKLRKTIKHAKREKLQQQLKDAKHNPKEQAKILKTLLPSRSSARTSPTEITYENKTYTDPTDIANAMNDHYITMQNERKYTTTRRTYRTRHPSQRLPTFQTTTYYRKRDDRHDEIYKRK